MRLTPFHIAVQVRDIEEARQFYTTVLGCSEGRSSAEWVDFNLFGHQFVCHLNPSLGRQGRIAAHYNPVDGHGVPVPHCGVVLEMDAWVSLAQRLNNIRCNSSSSPTSASRVSRASRRPCSSSIRPEMRWNSKLLRTSRRSFSRPEAGAVGSHPRAPARVTIHGKA